MKYKKTIITIFLISILLIAAGFFVVNHTKNQVKELFRMNKELQEEGYYMAEFEFKMLGLAYWLDRGHYLKTLSGINKLYKQMESKEGIIKVPEFKNKEEELKFYLNLQNPKTGAFMDDFYPYSAYTGPTGNVLAHLDALATETGKPLQLKYPLKYLDEINTPEKLNAYLDDVSTVGWIALKFPQTSFHNARDLFSLFHEDNTVEKHKLYDVTPEWKKELLKWFYDNQDPATGLWGPKSKSGKLVKKDTMNSASIMKAFVDEEGNNIHEDFPLRYKDELAKSFLEGSFYTLPEDNELDEWHEWELDTSKIIRTLVRYLWSDLSTETKTETEELAKFYIKNKFEKFFIEKEGAFSYYPNGEQATLDGTNGIVSFFKNVGAFSRDKQEKLWGNPEENIKELGIREISTVGESDLEMLINSEKVNSIRVYRTFPDKEYTENVEMVFYPKGALVLDIMDLTPKIKHWANTTPQTMGNWTSKEEIRQELEAFKFTEAPVYEKGIAIENMNSILQKNGKVVVIGFDLLQIPRYKITYEYLEK